MPKIFMLHRVLPEYDPDNYYFKRDTAISWRRFIAILDQIEMEGMQTLPISAVNRDSNRSSVFLTFDDGYADNAAALDEILRRGMRATVFPVQQFIQEAFSPIDDMAFHLMAHNDVPLDLYSSLMSGKFKKLLRRLSANRYRYLRRRWFGLINDASPWDLFLTNQQLSDFVSRGIELGIHGSSHRVFTSLTDNELLKELSDSRDWIHSLGIRGNLSICFPHGTHDQRITNICSGFGEFLLGVDALPLCETVKRRIHIKEVSNELDY
jgi:peptidoglycan/xylan/chitin deacetylase (PgdA/CDA1 family)